MVTFCSHWQPFYNFFPHVFPTFYTYSSYTEMSALCQLRLLAPGFEKEIWLGLDCGTLQHVFRDFLDDIFSFCLFFVFSFLFALQLLAEHPSPWRWWGGSCPARATPSSCAAQARTSSWSRAPTTAALMTRSAMQTPPRWRTLGVICRTHTRSCLKGNNSWKCIKGLRTEGYDKGFKIFKTDTLEFQPI